MRAAERLGQRGFCVDAYDCLLRSSEGATLRMANFKINKNGTRALLVLSSSKGQTRTGVQESLIVADPALIRWAAALKEMERPGDPLVPGGSCALRRKFRSLLKDAGLQKLDLQLYSLRRGGATNMFRNCASFDSVADRGRWRNVRTCRIYIDAASQDSAALKEDSSRERQVVGREAFRSFSENL